MKIYVIVPVIGLYIFNVLIQYVFLTNDYGQVASAGSAMELWLVV